jgi:8-oxo-dGTP pyrophosphatase MutT (NUDIX family)
MPHIHTKPGEVDMIAEVFVVYKNTVLIRLHDKYKIWIAPGGHIELDETPQEAAVREVKEETGLDVELYDGNKVANLNGSGKMKQLIPPMFMNIHNVDENHRHLPFVYFGTVKTNEIVQPDNEEKGECRWFTKEELIAADHIEDTVKSYTLKALELLAH